MAQHSPADSENPFAAPQSEDAPRPEPLAELHGRMPGSVMLAIGSLSVFLGLALLVVLATLSLGPNVGTFLIAAVIAAGVAIVLGLRRRSRAARMWARVYAVVFGGMIALVIATIAFSMMQVITDPEIQAEMQQAGGGFGIGMMVVGLLINVSIFGFPVVLLAVTFFALGATTARQFFGLICPRCYGKRVSAVNRSTDHLHCSGCGHEWQPQVTTT